MRWRLLAALVLAACMLACSCKAGPQNEKEDPVMDGTELTGFYSMMRSDVTSDEHTLGDVTKVLFYEDYDMLLLHTFAINIADKRMFTEPRLSLTMDYAEPDYQMTDAEVDEVLAILARNNVLAWDPVYGAMKGYEDGSEDGGGGWVLYLQYSDNTISRFCGTGPKYEGGCPESFEPFVRELAAFVDSRG